MELNLYGGADATLDIKSRFILPTNLKKKIPVEVENSFVLIKAQNEFCIYMYPRPAWEVLALQIAQLDPNIGNNLLFKKDIMGSLHELEMDSQNRILIPKSMAEYAKVSKELFLLGNGNKIEIWDKKTYSNLFTAKEVDGNHYDAGQIAKENNIRF